MLATVYDVSVSAINQHIKKIYEDNELEEDSIIKNFLIVQKEGNRKISRNVAHYNLQMIISVGFKVNNERAVQFRKWANQIVKDYTIKGWVMDDERLKNGGSILTEKYFEEQLERMVSAYLDLAEMQAMRHIPMTMADWEERLNGFLKLWDHEILKDNGKVSAEMAKLHAETEFEKYRIVQDQIYMSDFDKLVLNAKK